MTLSRPVGFSATRVVSAAALVALFALPALVAASPPGELISASEQEVVDLVNAERAKLGAAPLTVNYSLQEAAWVHNEHMESIGRICHSNCGDGDPGSRIAATGYRASGWGENVASSYPNPAAVMAAWMGSSGHRANILNRNFTDIGVAHNSYWTQVFSRPAGGYATVTPPAGSGGGGGVPDPTPLPCTVARDFDGDYHVTMDDVDLVRAAFMATPADPRWDPAFDVVPNGVVDVYDIMDVILAVGESGCQ
jgi:uncharacterized protein YkwD